MPAPQVEYHPFGYPEKPIAQTPFARVILAISKSLEKCCHCLLGGIFRGNLEMFQMMIGNNPLLYSTTDIIDTFVFRSLLTLGSLGMASAAGFFQSVVGLIMILTTNTLVRNINRERALY